MLSKQQIVRLVHGKAHQRLVRRILANGRCQDERIERRLLEPGAAAPAALGLGLQRLLELSWGMSPDLHLIIHRLLAFQSPDGLFREPATSPPALGAAGDGLAGERSADIDGPVVAVTAIALRGLGLWLARATSLPGEATTSLAARVRQAIEDGEAALGARLTPDLVDAVDAVDAAIVAWQLAGVEPIADRLDLGPLRRRLERDASAASLGGLFEFAYASAA